MEARKIKKEISNIVKEIKNAKNNQELKKLLEKIYSKGFLNGYKYFLSKILDKLDEKNISRIDRKWN